VTPRAAGPGAGGSGPGRLRLRSGSVLAPLLAHATLNDSALVAAAPRTG
jgi:hypothetical protein